MAAGEAAGLSEETEKAEPRLRFFAFLIKVAADG